MSQIAVPDSGASQLPAADYCDPKITGAVEGAFNDVWDVIKANDQRAAKPRLIVSEEWN
jgi:hypothetical protein